MILRKLIILTTVFLLFNVITGFSQPFYKIIAADGSGDYPSIKTAITNAPSATTKIFFIKNGTYAEKISITATKKVILIGESRDGVIITYDDYAGKSTSSSSTADSYTLMVSQPGFYAENITIRNTATAAQAVALYSYADTVVFKNCKIMGYQDTHYADGGGRQYFLNCETWGDVDFIFGNAAVMYDSSVIVSRNRKAGYITAPATSAITSTDANSNTIKHGILIKNSKIKAESGVTDNSCYLGRPWGDNAASVFYRCKIGTHISTTGWLSTTSSTYFAEYASKDSVGNTLDVSARASGSSQISGSDTSNYTITSFFKNWNPLLKPNALAAPTLVKKNNDTLYWNKIANARGYVVIRNDSATFFPTDTFVSIAGHTSATYHVKSVAPFGALSEASVTATWVGVNSISEEKIKIYVAYNTIYLPESCSAEIFSVSGQKLISKNLTDRVSIESLNTGIYIVKVTLSNKKVYIQKFYKQ